MLKAMYTRNDSCNLLTRQQAVEEFNLSASTIERLARECGAKLKIGSAVRFKKDVLQAHIDSFVING